MPVPTSSYSYTVGPENAVIANGKKALGWKVTQVGPWTLSFPFFLEGAKDAAEGALTVQTFIAEPSNERRASFLSGYTRKYQRKPAVPMAAANAYDATYLLMYSFLGIRDGNLTGPAIKESLEGKMKTVLRRGHHLRPPLQRHRQRRHHPQHAHRGHGEKRRRHLCLP